MSNRTKLTAKRKSDFILLLEERGNVSVACRAVGVARVTAYEHKNTDRTFAELWEEAMQNYADSLELEADRRAVEGTVKPIFYKGERISEVREYSDTLLIFRLKAIRPDQYRDRSQVDHSGSIAVIGIRVTPPAGAEQ